MLDGAGDELALALEELRELARGLHPAVLTDHGLCAAIEAVADRAPLPVTVDVPVDERLPETVEAAAYFVVCEALTNVAKYAQRLARRACASSAATATPRSRSSTTASAGPTSAAAPGCAAWSTASRRSAAGSSSRSPAGEGTAVRAQLPGRLSAEARDRGAIRRARGSARRP